MTSERLNILLVEDDPEDVFLIKKMIENAASDIVCLECVETLEAAGERLKNGGVHVVLLDLFLSDGDGLETLRRVRTLTPSTPVVVLTNLDDESAALDALNNGAQDYLVKGELNGSFFIRTIRHAIERQRIRSELNETTARLEKLTLVDPLTGLLNRRGLQQILNASMRRARLGSDFLALLIDIDDFKLVNDTHGHAVGDAVLIEIARRLADSLRSTDQASRVGGDEFILLLSGIRMAEGVQVAEKIRLLISGSPVILPDERRVRVTASLALAPLKSDVSSIDQLLEATHKSLARSKKTGKNQVSYNDHGGRVASNTNNAPGSIADQPFRVLKQSIFDLTDQTSFGSEFCTHSTVQNFEKPDDFFRLGFEQNSLTGMDFQCFKTCISAAAATLAPGGWCHVNLYPSTLVELTAQRLIKEIELKNRRFRCCIEISEQQIVGDPSYLVQSINELKKGGITVAIEDVGYGRSCFESLILLEPDIIKIDRRFVIGIAQDDAKIRSLKRILNVARVLDALVIAEGIENLDDLEVLRTLGVQFGQGFALERPQECFIGVSATC